MAGRLGIRTLVLTLLVLVGQVSLTLAQAPLVLTSQFDYFQVNGASKFLVFFSYFDAMRASDPTLDSDFGWMVSKGVNGIRIFANWQFPADTLMDSAGNLRPTKLDRLKQILTKAKTYGLLVDLTFTCDTVSGLDFPHYRDAIATTTSELSGDTYRHVLFDLQNESTKNSCRGSGSGFDTHDDERWALKDAVKNADPMRLITISVESNFGEVWATDKATLTQQDVIAYHDPRVSNWYDLTDDVVNAFRAPAARNCSALLAATANAPGTTRCKPLYLQEPNPDGTTGQHFIDAVKNAKVAGAAAWTFHNRAAFDLTLGTAQSQLNVDQAFFMNNFNGQLSPVLWEGNGMMDTYTQFFGVTGGAGGDDDGDGVNNVTEFQQGTHPTASTGLTRYFVEGRNDTFYGTRVALVNPSSTTSASVIVRFAKDDGTPVNIVRSLAPRTRQTIDATRVPGLRIMGFGTRVETNTRVVSDRTMYWDRVSGYGAHAERNITAPSTTWYMAEGSTAGAFDTKYILWNTNPFPLTISVRYLFPSGAPLTRTYTLNANQRFEYFADDDPAVASTDLAVHMSAGAPFLAERVTYFTNEGRVYNSGNAGAPISSPITLAFFAEGATGGYFDTYLLLANPTGSTAAVQAQYRVPGGGLVTKNYNLAPNSRTTIRVDSEDPALANTGFWVRLESTNSVPFVAERTVLWPDGVWRESHTSAADGATWPNWALAEGEYGFSIGESMYIIVANTSAFADTVTVTLLLEGGGTLSKNYTINALDRLVVDMSGEFPSAASQRFGALVQGLGGSQLVVERSQYWNANGIQWATGTNAFGTRF